MSTESEYLRESIEPKSDQLNADDLLTGPITVTVTGVRRGDKEQPVIVDIEGHAERPFKPGKSMRRVLIAAYGDDPVKWIGKRMTLYCDPEVKFGGVKVGGIRISHLSEIPNDRTFMLTVTRGKKSEFIVKRLNDKPATTPEPPALTDAEATYVADATSNIEQAESEESLKAIAFILKEKSEAVRNALRPAYDKRKKELEA